MDLSYAWTDLVGLNFKLKGGFRSSSSITHSSWTPNLPKAYSSHMKARSARMQTQLQRT